MEREDATFQSSPRQLGEVAFDRVEPRGRGRRKIERPTRVSGEPLTDLGMLVGGVVVDDAMDKLAGGHRCLDRIEEADEFLVPMLLHTTADDLAVQHVEGCEQRGGAVPDVVVRHGATAAFLQRQRPGWVRSSAWIWLFSSIESTTACAGGSTVEPDDLSQLAGELADRWKA